MFLAFVCGVDLFVAEVSAALRVPDGFTVTRVAGPPAIRFPMFACLDNAGRLYVAESSGLDLYAELRNQTRRCRISRLEDRDGDGTYEHASVFADKLVFPMGLVWREGKLYAADPPDLIVLRDTDGDGAADRREVLLTGFGHTDNGSLHGLTFGPDGWLYMTMGQPDGYRLARGDGTFLQGKSGALLRCRPDGSGVESVCRGFENLVEVIFMPEGEIIGTDNWFRRPEAGVRDALVHLLEGGVYPLDVHAKAERHFFRSGELLPAVAIYPAVALSGIVRYQSETFPAHYRDNAFAALFNSRKVVRHRFERQGATFRSIDTDFVTTDDPDFHPSDVLEAADGSLLVVDTGNWYIHHCPTGSNRTEPAPGAIYRVRYAPSGTVAAQPGGAAQARELELWEQGRRGGDLRPRLEDDSERVLAARVLARFPDPRATARLLHMLGDPRPQHRLAAAEALAHCGDSSIVPRLFSALASSAQQPEESAPLLRHALALAVHRLATADQLLQALGDARPQVRRLALILLDQPPHHRLQPSHVLANLGAVDETLRSAALSILAHHPEWADAGRAAVLDRLKNLSADSTDVQSFILLGLAFSNDAGVQHALANAVLDPGAARWKQAAILDIMARLGRQTFPEAWQPPLLSVLDAEDPELRVATARIGRIRGLTPLTARLAELAVRADTPALLRMEALAVRLVRQPQLNTPLFGFLLETLAPQQPPGVRLRAADLLGGARWADPVGDPAQLIAVIANDPLIAPSTFLPLLVQAEHEGWRAALAYIGGAIRAGWQPSEAELQIIAQKAAANESDEIQAFIRVVRQRRVNQTAEIDSRLELLNGGDPARGREIFERRAACAACHRVGAAGGLGGPDLTRVGAIRSGRDLLESIVLPSATFAQGYEPWAVTLPSGEELTGTLARYPDDSLALRDAAGIEHPLTPQLARAATRRAVSLMPEGLLGALSDQEIRDLLAFLQSLK